MKKAEKEKIRQKIGDVFDDWLNVLKLAGYSVYVLFPEDEGWEQADTGGMSVAVKYPYKDIHLYIPQDYIDNYKVKINNIAHSLLHEACHVLLWKINHLAFSRFVSNQELKDVDEETTDHLASVIWKLANNQKP